MGLRMKIDWKHLAITPGYRSLKAAYVHDIHSKARGKAELLIQFNWVISRAKHYAHHRKLSVEDVLNGWEGARNYWWLNYYQDCNQPKIRVNSIKNRGINGLRKYCKKSWYSSRTTQKAILRGRLEIAIRKRKQASKKLRWSMERKKEAKRRRKYLAR
jgi:hypothetical protein